MNFEEQNTKRYLVLEILSNGSSLMSFEDTSLKRGAVIEVW